MPKTYIPKKIKREILKLAEGRCEYCKSLAKYSLQPFHLDHIIPLVLEGETILDNLAYSCGGCNGIKNIKIEAFDPLSNLMIPFFHPRKEIWLEHFRWNDDKTLMIGISPSGRVTVNTLQLNRFEVVNMRKLTILSGEHPPE